MERHYSLFERLSPEMSAEDLCATYDMLAGKLTVAFSAKEYRRAQRLFSSDFTQIHPSVTMPLPGLDGYVVTRLANHYFNEVTIERSFGDDSHVASESIRLRIVNRSLSLGDKRLLEYQRRLKNADRRTLVNNFAATKRMERFVNQMAASVRPPKKR